MSLRYFKLHDFLRALTSWKYLSLNDLARKIIAGNHTRRRSGERANEQADAHFFLISPKISPRYLQYWKQSFYASKLESFHSSKQVIRVQEILKLIYSLGLKNTLPGRLGTILNSPCWGNLELLSWAKKKKHFCKINSLGLKTKLKFGVERSFFRRVKALTFFARNVAVPITFGADAKSLLRPLVDIFTNCMYNDDIEPMPWPKYGLRNIIIPRGAKNHPGPPTHKIHDPILLRKNRDESCPKLRAI